MIAVRFIVLPVALIVTPPASTMLALSGAQPDQRREILLGAEAWRNAWVRSDPQLRDNLEPH